MAKYGIFIDDSELAIVAMKTTVADPADGDWDSQDQHKRILAHDSKIKSLWARESPNSVISSNLFDVSDAGPNDPGAAWSNDSNAFADDELNANTIAAGSSGSNYLEGEGTAAPSSGPAITDVRLIVRAWADDIGNLGIRVTTDAAAETLLDHSSQSLTGTAADYLFSLTTPSGGWTYAKIQALEIRFWRAAGSNNDVRVVKSFVEVLGTGINVATQQENGRVAYHVFDPGTDTWTTLDEEVAVLGTSTYVLPPANPGCSIALRSDGDVIVFFGGTSGVPQEHVHYSIKTGSTWSTLVQINAILYTNPIAVGPDGSDRISCIMTETAGQDVEVISISSTDSKSGVFLLDDSADTADNLVAPGVIDSANQIFIPYIDASNKISVREFTSSASPGSSTLHADIGDNIVKGQGASAIPYVVACLAISGTDVHLLYANDADADIYHDDDVDGGGGTDVEIKDAVTAERLSCKFDSGGSNILYFYKNGATEVVYDTVVISGATVVVMTKADWAWTGQAFVDNAIEIIAMVNADWDWTGQSFEANAKAQVEMVNATWNWTGQAFNINETIIITKTDWTWTGQSFVLNARETISMVNATWVWTGQAFVDNAKETIQMVNATWNWTGQAFIALGAETIIMTKADWNWTGQAFVLNARETISMVNATWNWTGQSFVINAATLIVMTKADWNWTGQAFNINETIIMTSVSWNWTGQSFVTNAREIINMVNATWSWTGQAFLVNETQLMTAATWTWTSQAFDVNETVIITAATWLWTGQDFVLQEGDKIIMTKADWSWVGQAFNVNEVQIMTAVDWDWTGQSFEANARETISMVNAAWTWTGQDFTLAAPDVVQMANATWDWIGKTFALSDEGFTGNIVQVIGEVTVTDPIVYDVVFDPLERA